MANDANHSMGQAKDLEGPHGRRISEEQDRGELSAQNRGGTTDRGLEESKRLEEDDREQAADQKKATRAAERKLAEELQISDECEPTGESDDTAPSAQSPGIGHTLADDAARDAVNRPTESYAEPSKNPRAKGNDPDGDLSAR